MAQTRNACQYIMEATIHSCSSFSARKLALLGSAVFLTPAFADSNLAARFPNQSHVALSDLPALGSIPTILVNLEPGAMMQLLRQDIDEARRLFDRSKPSRLEPFITKMLHFPVGSSSRNSFSQGNPYICITTVNALIPAWHNKAVPPSSFTAPLNASRSCSDGTGVPLDKASSALRDLYKKFGVKVIFDPTGYKIQGLIPITQGTTTGTEYPEPNFGWGTAFFDTLNGRLQEVVWINATYTID